MSGQVPGFRREAHADIAADLADPHRLAVKANAGAPQSEMKTLVEAQAGALQREILLASTEVQRAYRGVAILRLQQEGLGGLPGGAQCERLGLVPGSQAFLDTGAIAHNNQVERIALNGSSGVAGGARLPLQPCLECRLVQFFGLPGQFRFIYRMGQHQPRHLDREWEVQGVAAAQ